MIRFWFFVTVFCFGFLFRFFVSVFCFGFFPRKCVTSGWLVDGYVFFPEVCYFRFLLMMMQRSDWVLSHVTLKEGLYFSHMVCGFLVCAFVSCEK